MSAFTSLSVVVIIVIAVAVIREKLASDGQKLDVSLYEKESALFSPAERSFLGVLDQAFDKQYRIMGKVRLADLIKVKSIRNRSMWQNAFNRIQSKHVDFVACDPTTLAVKFIIELDDASHNQTKRQERDDFLNRALQAAGIPVYHFAAKRTYSFEEIRQAILAVKPEASNDPVKSKGHHAEKGPNKKEKSCQADLPQGSSDSI